MDQIQGLSHMREDIQSFGPPPKVPSEYFSILQDKISLDDENSTTFVH